MSDENPIKTTTRKSTKVSRLKPVPLPPIDVAESMKVVLETLEYAKPKEKESVVDVSTGLQF